MSKTEDDSCVVEKAILKSFNRQSLLSNDDSGWSGIRFQFTHSISASALPEDIIFPENAIHIYTDIPSRSTPNRSVREPLCYPSTS